MQLLARTLPLAELRDRLPRVVAERLRFGLYPARITDAGRGRVRAHARALGRAGRARSVAPRGADAAPPRASILVVTYNNLALTRLCLASIAARRRHAAVRGHRRRQRVVRRHASVAARRRRRASSCRSSSSRTRTTPASPPPTIRRRRARAATCSCSSTTTCVVVPGWLETLVAHLDRDPSLGLLGPVTNSGGNGEAQLGTRYANLDGMRRFADDYTRAHAGDVADVPMLALFCAAMRAERFAAVGGSTSATAAACSRTTISRSPCVVAAGASPSRATSSCTITAARRSRACRPATICACGGKIAAPTSASGASSGSRDDGARLRRADSVVARRSAAARSCSCAAGSRRRRARGCARSSSSSTTTCSASTRAARRASTSARRRLAPPRGLFCPSSSTRSRAGTRARLRISRARRRRARRSADRLPRRPTRKTIAHRHADRHLPGDLQSRSDAARAPARVAARADARRLDLPHPRRRLAPRALGRDRGARAQRRALPRLPLRAQPRLLSQLRSRARARAVDDALRRALRPRRSLEPDKLAATIARARRRSARAARLLRHAHRRSRRPRALADLLASAPQQLSATSTRCSYANTVTGAASVFRGALLDAALPFPPPHGRAFHDHWLACAAFVAGGLAYVDRPLYDYTQHADNVIGHATFGAITVGGALARHARNVAEMIVKPHKVLRRTRAACSATISSTIAGCSSSPRRCAALPRDAPRAARHGRAVRRSPRRARSS